MYRLIQVIIFSVLLSPLVNAQVVFIDYSRLVNNKGVLPNTQSIGFEFGWQFNKMKLSGFVSSASSEEFKDQLDTLNYTFSTNILAYGIVASRQIELNDFLNWQLGVGLQQQNNSVYFSGNFIGSSNIKSWDALTNSGFEFKLIDELRLRLLATYSYRFSFTELSYRETTLNHRRSNLMIGVGVGYLFKN